VKANPGVRNSDNRVLLIPYLVTGISIVLTLLAWGIAQYLVAQKDALRFKDSMSDVTDAIGARLDLDSRTLRADAAYFATAKQLNRQEFERFAKDLLSPTDSPLVVSNLGFSIRVPVSTRNQLIDLAKQNDVYNFYPKLSPGGQFIVAALFSYPRNKNAHHGYNMYADKDRTNAMRDSLLSNDVRATGKLFYASDPKHTDPSFFAFMPVIQTQRADPIGFDPRKDKLLGFAFLGLHVSKLFDAVRAKYQLLDFQIFDTSKISAKSLFYGDKSKIDGIKNVPSDHVETITLLGEPWTFVFRPTRTFQEDSGAPLVPWILPLGFLVSLILGYLSHLQMKARNEAEAYALELARKAFAETLLGRAASTLASSLEYKLTLSNVAQLAVPGFADWCCIDVLEEDGTTTRITTHFDDVTKARWATDLSNALHPEQGPAKGALRILADSEPALINGGPRTIAERLSLQPGGLESAGVKSLLVAPLTARKKLFGLIWFAWADSGFEYNDDDLRLAAEIGERAGVAIDNARLFSAEQQEVVERKRAESQVRELNDHLELLVEERTRELQAANEELEAFCYSVSHDLRSPLRTIDGFSKALMEDFGSSLDSEAIDFLNRVRAASHRMDELITALLTLSRLTRAEIYPEDVDMSAMAREIASEIDPDGLAEITIQPEMQGFADPRMMRAVLDNLLSNAIKFSSKKERPEIEIGEHDGVFFVKDNGAGFNPEYANKLFQPFERLHTIREFPGSGIGLATVARIIKRHGGEVWANSKPEQGATFYFTLHEEANLRIHRA